MVLYLAAMLFLQSILILLMFTFKNSLFYSMSLLLISITTLSFLSLNSVLSTLTSLMLIIVYVGAMMILIGYICAVTPNLIVEVSKIYHVGLLLPVSFLVFSNLFTESFTPSVLNMSDFFYSFQGLFIFISLVSMLFITLLMVTSQHSMPQGPLRSICSLK